MCKNPYRSVKTRRKPLSGNDVFLQMAGSTRWRDSFSFGAINRQPVAWRKVEGVSRKKRANNGSRGSRPCLCDRLFFQMVIPSLRARRGNLICDLTAEAWKSVEMRGGELQRQRREKGVYIWRLRYWYISNCIESRGAYNGFCRIFSDKNIWKQINLQ